MTTQTTTLNGTPKTKTPVRRGWPCPCIKCGEPGGVQVNLEGLDGFFCTNCEQEFSREDVGAFVAAWVPCLAWLDAAPVLPE